MAPLRKILYQPIEAAIRWSGLHRHEDEILARLKGRQIPLPEDFPQWPQLRLNAERIEDALRNEELLCVIDGVRAPYRADAEPLQLTVRHVELKAWMKRFYPQEQPRFLFTLTERRAHPTITKEAVEVLIWERDALRAKLKGYARQTASTDHPPRTAGDNWALSTRADTTYLHIIGGMLTLLLGDSPAGHPLSVFRTQEAIIDAMIAHHGRRLGIAERTLQAKFAAARRALTKD